MPSGVSSNCCNTRKKNKISHEKVGDISQTFRPTLVYRTCDFAFFFLFTLICIFKKLSTYLERHKCERSLIYENKRKFPYFSFFFNLCISLRCFPVATVPEAFPFWCYQSPRRSIHWTHANSRLCWRVCVRVCCCAEHSKKNKSHHHIVKHNPHAEYHYVKSRNT